MSSRDAASEPRVTVHLFEPSGYAGVFQHSCRLAELLGRHGVDVVLHTGHEHEDLRPAGVRLCPCSWWPRSSAFGPLRSAKIAARFVTRTLPHLREIAGPGSVLHVQGIAAGGALTALTLGLARMTGRRVVYSPHDLFSRRGRVDGGFLRLALRLPHAVVVHSQADVQSLGGAGVVAGLSPLVQIIPGVTAKSRARWREEWRASETDAVVLFAGAIRPEKRLDLLIESARTWPSDRRLAVVGTDRGAWEGCARLARRYGVDVAARLSFLPLEEFAAALSAADLVVAPHELASQSGVLAVAAKLGTATVAADVGGLSELASRTFRPGDPRSLSRAIDLELAGGDVPRVALSEDLAVQAHWHAYALPGNRDAKLEQGTKDVSGRCLLMPEGHAIPGSSSWA